MEIKTVIKSTDYIEFINCLDDLINELLYSQESGYLKLTSKEALIKAQNILERYNFEADKLSKQYNLEDYENVIEQKRNELTKEIKRHYLSQVKKWSNEVFLKNINNNILRLSVYKNSIDEKSRIYDNIRCCALWYSNVNDLSQEEKKELFSLLNTKFNDALNSNDSDYIYKLNPEKSDFNTYFEIWDLISSNIIEFLKLDFSIFKEKLSSIDINYFIKLQNSAKINKYDVLDEINIINFALKKANIENVSDKYDFINQIQYDLSNKKIESDEQKAEIIKKRIRLFKNKEGYYKELFGF